MGFNGTSYNIIFLMLLTVTLGIAPASAADWTQFRGPDGLGAIQQLSNKTNQWKGSPETSWSVDIPGTGWSSPVYSGNRIWLTTALSKKATEAEIAEKFKDEPYPEIKTVASAIELHAICVDLESGDIVHDLLLESNSNPDPVNPLNSYASPTPAIADGKVICHFGSYGTWCIDVETGEQLWKKKYVVNHSVGPGSSPVIWQDNVILICDGMDKQYVVSLDLKSGEELWKTNRPPIRATNSELRKAFSTPLVIDVKGQPQVIAPSAQWFIAYDPATGQEIWRVDHGKGFSVTPMPIYEGGSVICASGYPELKLVAIDPTGSGNITKSHVKWSSRNAPAMPSLVATGGKLYAINDKGILNCLDAKTGDRISRTRIGGNFSASPLLIGDYIYLSSREGKFTVIKCNADLETVASHNFEEALMASPAVVGNDLILRTKTKLIRISSSW